MNTGELLTLILGGGAVATLTAIFSGVKSLKDGARARERETVKKLVTQRNDAWTEREYYIDVAEFWRNRCGDAEYKLRADYGFAMEPANPPKPLPVKESLDEEDEE